MERWSGRVAAVAGASGGIGGAIARALVSEGMKVVGLDCTPVDTQEADRLQKGPGKFFSIVADLTKDEGVASAFSWIKENLGGVDVLVNSAGVCHLQKLTDGKTMKWRQLIETNVLALSIWTREAFKSMKERGIDDGHIVHICSVPDVDGVSMYSATKHAVRALAEGLRFEINKENSRIRITNICPGLVNTRMITSLVKDEKLKSRPLLEPEDVADAVVYALFTPPRVQVQEITLRGNGEKL